MSDDKDLDNKEGYLITWKVWVDGEVAADPVEAAAVAKVHMMNQDRKEERFMVTQYPDKISEIIDVEVEKEEISSTPTVPNNNTIH